MDKEIVFSGTTTTPSDYAAPDGDLHLSINAIREYDVTHPIQQPYISSYAEVDGGIPIFIHRSPDFHSPHIIIQKTNGLSWRASDGKPAKTPVIADTSAINTVKSINSIGHWLIVTDDSSTHYILFEDDQYQYLGTHLPYAHVKLSSTPELLTHAVLGTGYDFNIINHSRSVVSFDGLKEIPSESNPSVRIPDDQADAFSEKAKSVFLELVKDVTDMGLFLFPHLIRVGIRLYNGSIVNVTEPVLVYGVSTRHALIAPYIYNSNGIRSGEFMAGVAPYRLSFLIDNLEELSRWSEVVKGIVFYSSSAIYDFDQNGRFDHLINAKYNSKNFCCVAIPEHPIPLYKQIENVSTYYKLYDFDLDNDNDKESYTSISVQGSFNEDVTISFMSSGDTISETIKFTSESTATENAARISAMLLKHGLTVYETGRRNIQKRKIIDKKVYYGGTYIERVTLAVVGNFNSFAISGDSQQKLSYANRPGQPIPSSLLTLSALETSDPFREESQNMSLRPISAAYTINYNMRQIYADISKQLYSPGKMPVFINGSDCGRYNRFFWHIAIDGKTVIVKTENEELKGNGDLEEIHYTNSLAHLSYPDIRCFKVIVRTNNYPDPLYYEFPLTRSSHFDISQFILAPYLRSVVCYIDLENFGNECEYIEPSQAKDIDKYRIGITTDPVTTVGYLEKLPSTIITSNPMNPFTWDAINERTVGSGRILGIATAAKPLSEGQSGQYPLYAFTTDGIYSMSVGSDGSINPGQPILQDIVYGNGESITSLDNSVIYACDRGIVELQGGTDTVLSDQLRDKPVNLFPSVQEELLPSLTSVLSKNFKHLVDTDITAVIDNHTIPLSDFIYDASMLYDSTSQRIYIFSRVFNESALVYSRKSQTFGLVTLINTRFIRTINSYPDSVFVAENADDEVRLCSFSESSLLTQPSRQADIDLCLLTRPLHLDARDVYKTIRSLILRGNYNEGSLGMAIYGSNDMKHWLPVASSQTSYIRNIHGTPYKYFRFLVLGNLSPDESIFSLQATFTPKLTNKPR